MIIGFVTAFPNRQKPKIVSIILVCIMIIITIVGQAIFQYFIRYATELKSNPIKITSDQFYILSTKRNSIVHMIINAISLLLIFTIPVYGKLLKKINTKVDVEDVIIEEINLVEDDEIY
jgi:phosphoglycerol transferase MdoB-like AlkP superfamily enzyme